MLRSGSTIRQTLEGNYYRYQLPLGTVSLPGFHHHLQGREKVPILLVKGEGLENLFQNLLVHVNFLKLCNKRMHDLLEGPSGDFEEKPGGYNY